MVVLLIGTALSVMNKGSVDSFSTTSVSVLFQV